MNLREAIEEAIYGLRYCTHVASEDRGRNAQVVEALKVGLIELGALERDAGLWRVCLRTSDFAVRVERTRCAEVCEWVAEQLTDHELAVAAKRCADEIRKRGDK